MEGYALYTFTIALIAGIASFFSPAVLPMAPGLLAFITGFDPDAPPTKPKGIANVFAFITGITLVFILVGSLIQLLLGRVEHSSFTYLRHAAGLFLAACGTLIVITPRVGWLRENRRPFSPRWPGAHPVLVSLKYGVSFALGWTPGVTPMYAAVLAMALMDPDDALPLLWGFSTGLFIPFIMLSLNPKCAKDWAIQNTRFAGVFSQMLGLALIAIGILTATDGMGVIPAATVEKWFDF